MTFGSVLSFSAAGAAFRPPCNLDVGFLSRTTRGIRRLPRASRSRAAPGGHPVHGVQGAERVARPGTASRSGGGRSNPSRRGRGGSTLRGRGSLADNGLKWDDVGILRRRGRVSVSRTQVERGDIANRWAHRRHDATMT
jgi:hypothetical protein